MKIDLEETSQYFRNLGEKGSMGPKKKKQTKQKIQKTKTKEPASFLRAKYS